VDDFSDEAVKRPAELHGFGGSKAYSLLVDSRERVVNNGAGPSFVLGYNAGGAYAEIFDMFYFVIREDHPKPLFYKVCHFFS
jgi:membrane-associated PAP2 superfamily phosphatase